MISAALANVVIVIVTAVWVTSFAVAMISVNYEPDPQINVIFMAVVGGAMALKAKRGDEEKKQ